MAGMRTGHIALALGATILLGGCEEGKEFDLFKKPTEVETADRAAASASSVKLVERDIEAPEVFQVTDKGLWDGRPSLGGVWVAHADVVDPERVIIRNEDNGKFVIGALFRRERSNPGPKLQVSSDAGAALGMLAGAPATLNVTALRRAELPVEEEDSAEAAEATEETLEPPAEIEIATLGPIAAASAALDKAEAAEETPGEKVATASAPPVMAPEAVTVEPAPVEPIAAAAAPEPAKRGLGLRMSKPLIQIGLFSEEANATRAGDALRRAGMIPTITKREANGKNLWRITVGPAANALERASLLKKIKGLGYSDAYFVAS